MEEIVTIDGRQFKLTVDRPLTAQEKAQTIAQIRQQTGCGTCGQPSVRSMDPNWGYGGIYSLTPTCTASTKASGQTINLATAPDGGVGPYTVRFWRKAGGTGGTYSMVGTTKTSVTEAFTVTDSIALVDADLAAATGDTTAGIPITGVSGIISDPFGGTAALSAARIRVATTTTDSCPAGAQYCVEYCDVNLACVAPTCNFVVT